MEFREPTLVKYLEATSAKGVAVVAADILFAVSLHGRDCIWKVGKGFDLNGMKEGLTKDDLVNAFANLAGNAPDLLGCRLITGEATLGRSRSWTICLVCGLMPYLNVQLDRLNSEISPEEEAAVGELGEEAAIKGIVDICLDSQRYVGSPFALYFYFKMQKLQLPSRRHSGGDLPNLYGHFAAAISNESDQNNAVREYNWQEIVEWSDCFDKLIAEPGRSSTILPILSKLNVSIIGWISARI
jgi:hypothetical protein